MEVPKACAWTEIGRADFLLERGVLVTASLSRKELLLAAMAVRRWTPEAER